MPKHAFSLLFFFLFLFLFSTNAYAYITPDLNVTYSGGLLSARWLACTNNTGTFYCYNLATPSGSNPHIYIERYNSTWGDRKWCDSGLSGIAYTIGLGIVNSTHIAWVQIDDTIRYIDISNMTLNTTCPTSAQVTNFSTDSLHYYQAGYVNDSGVNYLYMPGSSGIRFAENGSFVGDSFWDTTHVDGLRFPNQTNSELLYGTYESLVLKYVNGSYDSAIGELYTAYGICNGQCSWDLYKQGSTTWLYVGGGQLYRFNFTTFELTSGGSSIVAVSPIGNITIADTTPQLHSIVYSALNGTIGWTIDGVFKENNTVITDGISSDAYYTPTALTSGAHNWTATYYDSLGNSWVTGTQTFNIGTTTNILTDGAEGLSGLVGSLFGVTDQTIANTFFSLIASVIAGVSVAYLVRKEGEMVGKAFLGTVVIMLIAFSVIGWFPAIIMILLGAFILLSVTGVLSKLFSGGG